MMWKHDWNILFLFHVVSHSNFIGPHRSSAFCAAIYIFVSLVEWKIQMMFNKMLHLCPDLLMSVCFGLCHILLLLIQEFILPNFFFQHFFFLYCICCIFYKAKWSETITISTQLYNDNRAYSHLVAPQRHSCCCIVL